MTEVIEILSIMLKDEEYREGWIANIAMAYKDCERWYKEKTGKKYLNSNDKHIIANNAGKHFINILTGDD